MASLVDHQSQLLEETLDCALQDSGSFRVAFGEKRVERFLGNFVARLIAERVFAGLAGELAPILDDIAKGPRWRGRR